MSTPQWHQPAAPHPPLQPTSNTPNTSTTWPQSVVSQQYVRLAPHPWSPNPAEQSSTFIARSSSPEDSSSTRSPESSPSLAPTSPPLSSRGCTNIVPLIVHENCAHKAFFSKNGMAELVAWVSDIDNARRLFNRRKGVKKYDVHMEISDFVDLNANVFWDDQKVMSQIQKLEKYWHETDKNFSRSGNRDSLSPTLRAQILEHNPSFFHLEAVMTKKWSAKRKVVHRSGIVKRFNASYLAGGEGSTDSISSDEDRRAKRRRYDGSTVKRRREDDWDACMNNIVDKLITKKPASQKTAWDIVSLLEERLEQAHKDLRDAQARLAQEEMQLMQLMQEKFDLMLRVQLLEESQRRCNCSSSS